MPSKAQQIADYEEELEAWARRMIDEVSEFDKAMSRTAWRRFCADKLYKFFGKPASYGQLDALELGRLPLIQFREDLGYRAETPYKAKDLTKIRYRDMLGKYQRKGTFISSKKLRERIVEEKRERGDWVPAKEEKKKEEVWYKAETPFQDKTKIRYRDVTGKYQRKNSFISAERIRKIQEQEKGENK